MKGYSTKMKLDLHKDSLRYVDLAIVCNFIFAIINFISEPSSFHLNLLIIAPLSTAIILLIYRCTSALRSKSTAVLIPLIYFSILIVELLFVGLPVLPEGISSPNGENKGILLLLIINAMPSVYIISRIALLFLLGIFTLWTFRLEESVNT